MLQRISVAFMGFVFLFLAAITYSQSPREELKQLTAQLQSNPTDTALREKIIKLAQQIKPIPAVPEEAQRRLGRGQAAFETAKEPPDFDKAIAEFNAAANVAPWLAAPYYNLGVAHNLGKGDATLYRSIVFSLTGKRHLNRYFVFPPESGTVPQLLR